MKSPQIFLQNHAKLFDLTGQTALVTGASSGLGRHFSQVLAQAGASVFMAARRLEMLADTCASIKNAGGMALPVKLDVTDMLAVETAISKIGPDIVVNNAGVASNEGALELEESDWDFVIDTNLKGAFAVAQSAARAMVEHGKGGSIVNIASITGLRAAGRIAPYAVSKAGLVHLTKVLALEWARHGIRVNAICPGYIETDLNRDFFNTEQGKTMIRRIPQRRLGQMGDLDGALLLLASSAGAFMTGSIVTVDGGHMVSTL